MESKVPSALNQLRNDVLKKTNGCDETGEPDKNDWIEDCVTQDQFYPFILEAIGRLESLI